MLRAMSEAPEPGKRGKVDAALPAVGLAIGVLPFSLSFRETREQSFVMSPNGAQISQTTHRTAFDYLAVPCGGLAIVLGLYGLVRALPSRRLVVLGVGAAAVLVGLLQVVRGLLP